MFSLNLSKNKTLKEDKKTQDVLDNESTLHTHLINHLSGVSLFSGM